MKNQDKISFAINQIPVNNCDGSANENAIKAVRYLQEVHEILSRHDVSSWINVKDGLPNDDNQVFVKYENEKYGINEYYESDKCWRYNFTNMIVKEWCKPPCH